MKINELEWTSFEEEVINVSREIVSQSLSNKGVIPPNSRIHILSGKEFNTKIIQPEQRGFVGGIVREEHIYLKRTRTKSDFIRIFTHELNHFVSFLGPGKVGMNRIKGSHRYFEGFDEAVTEIFAFQLRAVLLRRIKPHHKTLHALRFLTAFAPAIFVVRALIKRSSQRGVEETVRKLFRDYIEGTENTLRSFNYHVPGSWQALKYMGKNDEEAIRVAKELGLDEVLEEMKLATRRGTS